MTPFSNRSRTQARRLARGFTLIEVLVAVLVLSLGVLGAAGMQATSLRANREARMQEVGTRLAAELAELIRANQALALGVTSANNPYLVSFTTTPPTTTLSCFTTTNCLDSADIARRDMADWAARAASLLPGIRATVCYDTAPYNSDGQPQWTCTNTGDTLQIKLGWARSDLNRSTNSMDAASKPAVVLPIKPAKSYPT